MQDLLPNPNKAARQVELAVGRLDSLSTLPCVGLQLFSRLLQGQLSPSALGDVIEADPALAAKCLSLVCRRGVSLSAARFSLRRALDELPAHEVRDELLSVRAFQPFELDYPGAGGGATFRRDLLLHSLAVACCAREIAEAVSPRADSELVYYAGLLHDIGKLALREVMPKSFSRIFEQAESATESSRTAEQRNLGLDHTIVGKHLAQEWQLPNAVVLAAWLHHGDTVTISQDMPEAWIAAVVQLADSVARQSNVGISGSFDLPEAPEPIAECLGIGIEQVRQIGENLPGVVAEKSKVLGLNSPNALVDYCRAAHTAAGQLARKHTELSVENRRLQSSASHFDFTADFLLGTSPAVRTANIAQDFAVRWQKFYQTGTVCLYLAPSGRPEAIEAVVVEKLSQTRVVSVDVADNVPVIPEVIANKFAVVNACDHLDWLLEQVDADFDAKRTRLVPLLCDGRAVGAIAFELHYPGDAELFAEKFRTSAAIAGSVLGMALSRQKQQDFAERFVRLISRPKIAGDLPAGQEVPPPGPIAGAAESLTALAEIAAGAAHELNNPLAVISGRAQLLAEAEEDVEKKEILRQICENAREASGIIEDLMSFAEPPRPRVAGADVKKMLDEAVQLAGRKTSIKDLDIRIEIADDVGPVFVDSAQIVSAIANIISNAAESYGDQAGPITITAGADESGETIELAIQDQGCGMDEATLKKATQPFFSAREAGRKRGMGLAYAARFVQLNKGMLNITSEPGIGTTATIHLPGK
ncbi:MAG: HDOD domain-containing protein [Planctomycetes bacterium]|nr:HDOD domain-containing protein [Planctomycetota bacterium]MBL7188301.1 HDOD domain-containing protein [Phycisphaerae bacterium]